MENLLNPLRTWMASAPQGQTREATVRVRGDGLSVRLEVSGRPFMNVSIDGFLPWPQIDADPAVLPKFADVMAARLERI